jgi:hypothetical protein
MNEFPVPKNAYVAFDGLTIKQKIKDRLNQTGIFTDQNYEGSNLAAFNDSVAMSFSLLLYYLNQSSVNGQFSETTIYENINRIVKELDYKPVGHQTASVCFTMTAQNLAAGFYTIPRYSSISIGGLIYSLVNDLSFTKSQNTVSEEISGIESDAVLYQGTFVELPIYTAAGTGNEILYVSVDDAAIVDNFNIHVYVKIDGVWEKWNKTQSLYINNFSDRVYELRFNENKIYELKFGDDINGRKLNSGEEVLVYYLKSDGKSGEIGVGGLKTRKLSSSISNNLNSILSTTGVSYMTSQQMLNLTFDNKFPSTYYSSPESVASIRKNAPGVFRSQFNVTTAKSYETFIKSNFSNIISDVRVKNNKEYLDSYIKYFYDIGLTKPQLESRALFNQINYADSCNFNNVYLFVVPKTIKNSLSYLTPSQKELILNTIRDEQVLTSETILVDPVYISFDLGLQIENTITEQNIKDTELYVAKSLNSRRSESSIKEDIQNMFLSYFDSSTNTLGQRVNIQQLNVDLLNIDGVGELYMRNRVTGSYVRGLRMVQWNPVYFDLTINQTGSVVTLESFQFPFLNNKQFVERITVV